MALLEGGACFALRRRGVEPASQDSTERGSATAPTVRPGWRGRRPRKKGSPAFTSFDWPFSKWRARRASPKCNVDTSKSMKSHVCQTSTAGPAAHSSTQESSYFILQTSKFYSTRSATRSTRGAQWLAGGTRRHRHVSLVAKGGPLQHPDELRALLLGHEPGDAREHLGTVRLIHGHELLLHQLDALAVVDCL